MMGISVWKLLIILAIVIVLFGTGRLSGIGSDWARPCGDFVTCWAKKRASKKTSSGYPQSLQPLVASGRQHDGVRDASSRIPSGALLPPST